MLIPPVCRCCCALRPLQVFHLPIVRAILPWLSETVRPQVADWGGVVKVRERQCLPTCFRVRVPAAHIQRLAAPAEVGMNGRAST